VSAQSEHKSKLEEALARVAEQRAQALAARPTSKPTPRRAPPPRTTPREERPSAPAAGPPSGKVLLGLADLRALGIPYSRAHLHRLMHAGKFPRPVALGPEVRARKAWRADDIERWLASLPYIHSAENEEAAT
jgi:predicted DNA-binding transcriptional regulator AlpA